MAETTQTADSKAEALLKAPEVARVLGVDVRTVWRWASSGTIPAPLRIGGTTRWRRSELDAFLDAKAQQAARENPHAVRCAP